MATRGNCRFDIVRPRTRERRRRQDLSRRRDQVSIASEEKQRAAQFTQIDEAAERMEPACGDAVLTKEPVEDFQKIGPRKIERPPLPAQEGLDRSAIFFVCGCAWELKRIDDERELVVLPRPEFEQSPAENQSISRLGSCRRSPLRALSSLPPKGETAPPSSRLAHRQARAAALFQRNVQRKPARAATLAQADEIHRRSDVIHGDIEITKIAVDRA